MIVWFVCSSFVCALSLIQHRHESTRIADVYKYAVTHIGKCHLNPDSFPLDKVSFEISYSTSDGNILLTTTK